MEYKYQRVPLDQIDTDDKTYRISTSEASALLVESIKSTGVINLPTLLSKGERHTILTGFSRIDACRLIGMRNLNCRVLPEDTDGARCARIAIIDDAMQRGLNLIEQANAIRLLRQAYPEDAQLVAAARACGLPVNRNMVSKLTVLGKMPVSVQQAVLDGAVALPVALQMDTMEDISSIEAFTKLFLEIKVGLNLQRELIDWTTAVAKRDDTSIDKLLTTGEIHRHRANPEKDHRQKARLIRQTLRKMRFPSLSDHERRYERIVHSLKLKKGTRLTAPAHFEGRTYGLVFEFHDFDELVDRHHEFERLIKSSAIKTLWTEDT